MSKLKPPNKDNSFQDMSLIFCRVTENGVYQAQGRFYEAHEVMSEILSTCEEFLIYETSLHWEIHFASDFGL